MKLNTIICGDTLTELKKFPDESVDCIITSPPYWGLRDYGTATWKGGDKNCDHQIGRNTRKGNTWMKSKLTEGTYGDEAIKNGAICPKCGAKRIDQQLGLEPTLEEYLQNMLAITAELKRILKKTGTMFWNHGDAYASQHTGGDPSSKSMNKGRKLESAQSIRQPDGKKMFLQKSLLLQNFRLAIRMMDEQGWIMRNTAIWHKPNCMPSSIKDRFTVDFEPVFFFVKNNKTAYWVNIKTGAVSKKQPLGLKGKKDIDWEWAMVGEIDGVTNFNVRVRDSKKNRFIQKATDEEIQNYGKPKMKKVSLWRSRDYYFEMPYEKADYDGRKDTYYKGGPKDMAGGAHERWQQDSEGNYLRNKRCVWKIPTKPLSEAHFAVFPDSLIEMPIQAGCPAEICLKCGLPREKIQNGKTNCGCNADFRPGIVLDPFSGAGTTALVALQLKRNYIGIELNPLYITIAEKRLAGVHPSLF